MKKIVILFFAVLAQAVYVFGEGLARELERDCAKGGPTILPDASHTPFRDSVRVSTVFVATGGGNTSFFMIPVVSRKPPPVATLCPHISQGIRHAVISMGW